MTEKQEVVTFSTDVLSMFANPEEVQKLGERAGFNCNVEVIAMPVQYCGLKDISRGEKKKFDLGGVHGKLGVDFKPFDNPKGLVDWFKSKAADLLLPPVMGYRKLSSSIPIGMRMNMIGFLTGNDVYFNVHSDDVLNNFSDYQRNANFAQYSHLTIENGLVSDDVARVNDLVCRLADGGAERTCGTFDLVHAIIAMSGGKIDIGTVSKFWNKILKQISNKFGHLHFPIGLVKDDSLPIMEMIREKMMLKDLADWQKQSKVKITFENQHNLIWGANIKVEERRLKIIRDGLLKCDFNV